MKLKQIPNQALLLQVLSLDIRQEDWRAVRVLDVDFYDGFCR